MVKTESDTAIREVRDGDDPVLSMLGVGKQLWLQESGDSFIERLRSEALPGPPFIGQPESPEQSLLEAVWRRIESTGLPFTFEVAGSGIWFFREGRRINRKLTRTQVEVAISRCPLASTTEIKDLMDFAYLFALLMDPRIRNAAW